MLLRDLFFNLTILLAISVLSGFIDLRFTRSGLPGKILQGLLFGLACVVGMIYPFVMEEGLIFDGRSIILSLAALFFGPLTGIISGSIAIIYRVFFVGGSGMVMGTAVILTSMGFGLAFHYWLKMKKGRKLKPGNLYLFGLLVHIFMLLDMFFLPKTYIAEVFQITGFSVIIIYPIASMLIGKILLDQSQNKALIDEISDNEELYRTTLYSVNEAIITTDNHAGILQMNPVAEKLTGWTENEAINLDIDTVFLLVDELKNEPIQNTVKEVIRNNQPFQSEDNILLKSKTGNEIPITFRCSIRTNSTGDVIGTVIVINDQRRERQNKLALLQSAENYKGLFNSMAGAIYILDREGRFIDVNIGATLSYGYTREEIIGKRPDFLSAPDKNNLKLVDSYFAAAFSGKPQHFEFWGKRKNGDIFPKEINIYKTNYNEQEALIAFGLDITERKLAQLELAESEERYRTLFNSAPVGILLIDQNATIINVNETACKQYGYTSDELTGQKLEIIVLDKYKPAVKGNIQKIIQNKILLSTVTGVTKSGEPKVFDLIESVITLPNGEKGILSISKDITEQVQADKIIKENEARNKAIISAIPDLFFRLDKDGYFIDAIVDDDSKLILPFEESHGKTVTDLLPQKVAELTLDAISKTIQTGELIHFEYDLEFNNKIQWFDARIVRSGTNEVLAIIRDISERKYAEEELKNKSRFIETLLDSLPNPLFYMDKKGRYLGINQAFREFYQVQNQDFIGKYIYEIDPTETAAINMASDKLIFDGVELRQTLDRTVVLPNGEERDVIITKSPFPDASNKIGGLIGLIVDITQRKKMEQDLLTAKNKAEESDRLKTSFLNNLSHEIRTPLNAIVGFSDLLSGSYSDEQKDSFIEIINNNSNQLLHIIDDVLAVARLESEKIPVDYEVFSIQELFDDLYYTFVQEVVKKNLVLRRPQLSADVPKNVFQDKGKIRQVLAGFIENAIKYTPNGSIEMNCQMEGDQLQFSVKDTGMGIDVQEQPRIFDRFYRTNEVQLKAIRGNGLGLSIAKSLVELLDGTIGIESIKNVGSKFYFNLPVHQNTQSIKSFAKDKKTGLQDISSFNVLIVEDEIDNYNYLASLIQPRVKSVLHAISGAEAIKLVDQFPFHVVLMDLKLPVINGVDATRIIKEKHPDLPIIAVSAHTANDEIKKALDAGCFSYLTKPVNKEKLLAVINSI
jgi:PAS domain S-box-containing protein